MLFVLKSCVEALWAFPMMRPVSLASWEMEIPERFKVCVVPVICENLSVIIRNMPFPARLIIEIVTHCITYWPFV